MSENEHSLLDVADRFVLQARAAHVFLDAAAAVKNAAQQTSNIRKAQEILAVLDRELGAIAAADPVRPRLIALCERLRARLAEGAP